MQEGEIHVTPWLSVLDVSQQVVSAWLILLQQRRLSDEKLIEQKEAIENGLYTWLLTRYLNSATLELYQEQSGEIIERWKIIFHYQAGPEEHVQGSLRQDMSGSLLSMVDKLLPLPAGITYRIVLEFDTVESRPPPDVKGWDIDGLIGRLR